MHELGQRLGRAVQVFNSQQVDAMGPCKDQRLTEYEPDTIILWTDSHHQHLQHAVVVEFTCSIREDADTHHRKILEKVQAYQTTVHQVLHLQKLWGQSVKVSQQ
eukprot:1299998-Rhodomonas_salina.1